MAVGVRIETEEQPRKLAGVKSSQSEKGSCLVLHEAKTSTVSIPNRAMIDNMTSPSDDLDTVADFALPESDTPVNLRPDLSIHGIQEVDRGICEDNADNRSILRKAKLSWIAMYDSTGRPLHTIEVRSREMIEARGLDALEGRKMLLKDPRDRNSDYITGLDLLYEDKSESLVPAWILAATRSYERILEERAANPGKAITPRLVSPPGRCSVIKSDAVRCQLWHSGRESDRGMCRTHLGARSNTSAGAIEKARTRIAQNAPQAVDVLEELMLHATSEPARLGAAKEILDRAGVRGGVEIEVVVSDGRPAGEVLRERLEGLKAGAAKRAEIEAAAEAEIQYAEVVETEDTEK